jgi:hypothetical protein
MTGLIHSTDSNFSGPWLLDRDALDAFDALMDEESQKLRDLRETKLAESVERELQNDLKRRSRYETKEPTAKEIEQMRKVNAENLGRLRAYAAEDRVITIHFRSKKRIRVSRFSDAFRMPELAEELPTGFNAEYSCGGISASVSLNKYGSSFGVPGLEIAVSPDTEQASKELYAVLRGWERSFRPSLLHQKWSSITLCLWIVWGLAFGVTVGAASADSSGRLYRDQGRAMLQGGLKPGDELKALETILAIETGYAPTPTATTPSRRGASIVVGLFIACCLISVRPKFAISIGIGENRTKYWRRYANFIFVTIPCGLMSLFFWPFIADWLKHLAI